MAVKDWLANLNTKYKEKETQWQNNFNNNSSNGTDPNRGGSTGFNFGPMVGGIGSLMSAGSTMFGKQYNDPQFAGEQAASRFLGNFGWWGAAIGGATSVSSQLTRAMGSNIGHVTQDTNDVAGGSKLGWLLNNGLGSVSNMTGGLADAFSVKLNDFNINSDTQALFSPFSGEARKMLASEGISGSKIIANKNEYQNLVDTSIKNQDLMTSIGLDNQRRISSTPYVSNMREHQDYNVKNGMTAQNYNIRTGKSGIKMLSREELDKIYSARKRQDNASDDIQKFQNGGSILIPDGALHAHKHHMEDVNPELAEDLTKKGIPVVSTDENGEVTQVAEIERQEIIFEKSLTEQIEKLWKEGSEEAMIEAGKLIAETLMTNCDDNVNLVKEVE